MKLLILGSTGSIGLNTLSCIRRFPDKYKVTGLAVKSNIDGLSGQCAEFSPENVFVGDDKACEKAENILSSSINIYSGYKGLARIVEETDFDVLVNALVGFAGFEPTVIAIKRNKKVALANKESLVVGGELITSLLESGLGELIPVDSEHSAVLQCLNGENTDSVEKVILTASGGPFREMSKEELINVTPEQALAHPTWSMGNKITIDSATLMNKGFELLEAHHLFSLNYDRLDVLVHPQSIVHSMVLFHDGAVITQCGLPDMQLPIQYALSYPERLPVKGRRLDLSSIESLTFYKPDYERFPCLKICLECGAAGGSAPVVLNSANEVVVDRFLKNDIRFNQIPSIIENMLNSIEPTDLEDVETFKEFDSLVREKTKSYIRKIA